MVSTSIRRTSNRSSSSKSSLPPADPQQLAKQYYINLMGMDGNMKDAAKLRAEVEAVKSATRKLEHVLGRALPAFTVRKIASLVNQGVETDTIPEYLPLLDLPDDNDEYQALFPDHKPSEADQLYLKHKTSLHDIPTETRHWFVKNFHNDKKPFQTIHSWADAQAVEHIMPTGKSKGYILIETRLLEWYSDGFVNAVRGLLDQEMTPEDWTPVYCCNTCNYEVRAALTEKLMLQPMSMWNEPLDNMTHERYKAWLKVENKATHGEREHALQTYVQRRTSRFPFSPFSSAQSAIDNMVNTRSAAPVTSTDRKLVPLQLTKEEAAKFRKHVEGIRQPGRCTFTVSQWADLEAIAVPNTENLGHQPKLFLDESLIEFHSEDFLRLVVQLLLKTDPPKSMKRADLIDTLIKMQSLSVQYMSHRLPTHPQLQAYKRYIGSDMCAWKNKHILANSVDSWLKDRILSYAECPVPLSYAWLAIRCSGRLVGDETTRKATLKLSKTESEDDLAKKAYQDSHDSHTETARELLNLAADALCPPKEVQWPVPTQQTYLLLRQFAKRAPITTADTDVLQMVIAAQACPTLKLKQNTLESVSDKLFHLLLHIICDHTQQRPDTLIPYRGYQYPKHYREGLMVFASKNTKVGITIKNNYSYCLSSE